MLIFLFFFFFLNNIPIKLQNNMDFFVQWFNFNNVNFTTSSSNDVIKNTQSNFLKCFSYNLLKYIQCFLPIISKDIDQIYKSLSLCIDTSFTNIDSKYTKVFGSQQLKNPTDQLKVLSIMILDNVINRLILFKEQLKSSFHDLLQLKKFMDNIRIELPNLLIDNIQKNHLLEYMISPYKIHSKIEITEEMSTIEYLISHTDITTKDTRQYLEIMKLSKKTNNSLHEKAHLYFCQDCSITYKLDSEVNPYVVYSSFLLHQTKHCGHIFFSFYSQSFTNLFSSVITNTCFENNVYKNILMNTVNLAICRLQIHFNNIIGNINKNLISPTTNKTEYDRHGKLLLKTNRLSKQLIPLHSTTYYYFLDPTFNFIEDVYDISPDDTLLYFENQNIINETDLTFNIKHSKLLFFECYLNNNISDYNQTYILHRQNFYLVIQIVLLMDSNIV